MQAKEAQVAIALTATVRGVAPHRLQPVGEQPQRKWLALGCHGTARVEKEPAEGGAHSDSATHGDTLGGALFWGLYLGATVLRNEYP